MTHSPFHHPTARSSTLPQATPLAGQMLATAVLCGYLYQGPPFRFSYLGLGEPLCFLAFGPLATNAFYLAQVGSCGGGGCGLELGWGWGKRTEKSVALCCY